AQGVLKKHPFCGAFLVFWGFKFLSMDERTIRKWKSGETRMVFTTWCCLCWLAGLGMLLEEPA
ncbi:hypothetical protein ACP0G4_24900, partial [Escherichia coli]